MSLRTHCARRLARTRAPLTAWQRVPARAYVIAAAEDAAGFEQLRTEMLSRQSTSTREHIDANVVYKLLDTLSTFLPQEWCPRPHRNSEVLPMGHHLVWFNASMPVHMLLPDGTDPLQSPGKPWVRRMWAGGGIRVKPGTYYQAETGFATDYAVVCAERIQDVQLRGQGDAAKIFVTIDRRYARLDAIQAKYQDASKSAQKASGSRVGPLAYYREQLLSDDWGDAIMREQRNLVFLKEKSPAELEAIQAGTMATLKYLDRPGEPEFSHTLIPTRTLLFRYSALTFNAHLIHLDPSYARDVEGHRNIIVHGPLSLTLMLQIMTGYIKDKSSGKELLESIDYRNLAPLYCDEPMRICCLKKSSSSDGSAYDVWIEGPAGGVAVKGTIRTATRSFSRTTDRTQTPQLGSDIGNPRPLIRHVSPRSDVDNPSRLIRPVSADGDFGTSRPVVRHRPKRSGALSKTDRTKKGKTESDTKKPGPEVQGEA